MKIFLVFAVVLQVTLAQSSDARYESACEGETIDLECGAGEVIRIVSAFYGRQDAVTCRDRNIADQNCVSGSAQYIVTDSCNDKQSCSVYSSLQVFGDPCPRTSKYTEITYTCVRSDLKTVVSCNGSTINMRCPPGQVLEIVKANYGRTDGVTCPSSAMSNKNCHAADSTERVQDLCNCKPNCGVSPNIFGDPCYGTAKYLDIQYHCISKCQCYRNNPCLKCEKPCHKRDDDDCGCDAGAKYYAETNPK